LADTMKELRFPSLPLRLFEYFTTLGVGTFAATAITRSNFSHGPLFVMTFIIPSCLVALFIIFAGYYYFRIFVVSNSLYRLTQSVSLAIVSTILSVPLYLLFEQSFWPPYHYGPGP
jgi:hypothetical protein